MHTTKFYPLSLHDALPILDDVLMNDVAPKDRDIAMVFQNYALYPHMDVYNNMAFGLKLRDRKSTRLNSSHVAISYAVFCLKKKPPENAERRILERLIDTQL